MKKIGLVGGTGPESTLMYYRELLNRFSILAEESLMIGNDVEEDMVASQLGMDTFLITDCMINTKGKDVSTFNHGTFEDLRTYIGM